MPNVTLSTKGQLVIPKAVRTRLGWEAGARLELCELGSDLVIRPAPPDRTLTVDDLVGCLPWSGPPKTLADMEAGIARGARRAVAKGRGPLPADPPVESP